MSFAFSDKNLYYVDMYALQFHVESLEILSSPFHMYNAHLQIASSLFAPSSVHFILVQQISILLDAVFGLENSLWQLKAVLYQSRERGRATEFSFYCFSISRDCSTMQNYIIKKRMLSTMKRAEMMMKTCDILFMERKRNILD